MDIKKTSSSRRHSTRKKRRKGDTDQLAAQLAPLEEQDRDAAEQQVGVSLKGTGQHFGAIVVDNDDLPVPKDIGEGPEEKHFLGIEPVVLVVLVLVIVFIAFITWQISLMPAK